MSVMGQAVGSTIASILVIDDDPHLLAALSRSLGLHRTVFTASNLQVATTIARRERPDLAIVDMRLANESGLEIVRALKAELPSTKFAVMSGYLSVESTVAAVQAGADLVVTKPVHGSEILRRVEEAPVASDDPKTPTLAEAEIDHIARVMIDCNGNISEAARRLGIHRSSLQRKLRKPQPRS